MLKKVWACTNGYFKGAKIEQHEYRNGETHYSFRDRLGRPSNVNSVAEAEKLIAAYHMEDVTDRMSGWIATN